MTPPSQPTQLGRLVPATFLDTELCQQPKAVIAETVGRGPVDAWLMDQALTDSALLAADKLTLQAEIEELRQKLVWTGESFLAARTRADRAETVVEAALEELDEFSGPKLRAALAALEEKPE